MLKELEKRFDEEFSQGDGFIYCNLDVVKQFIKQEIKKAFEEILPKEKYCEYCDDRSVDIIRDNIKKYFNN